MPLAAPFASQPLFADESALARLPAPLAGPLAVLVSEIETSGEATTADETAAAIEALARWLGRLWLAEYLRAVAIDAGRTDEALNRDLVERIGSGRTTLTGHWVGLARRAREALTGWDTVVPGLAAIEFGAPGDGGSIDRLLHFRNHFSHGSFAETVVQIRAHRQLLHDVLAAVPALWQPPPLSSGGPALDMPGEELSALLLLEHPALSAWLVRYERERQGFLPYDGPTAWERLHHEVADELRDRLASPAPGLILVEGHPGCDAGAAVAALGDTDPLRLGLDRFAAVRRVAVRPGDLSQSGLTVGRIVLRAIEAALGEPPRSRPADRKDLLSAGGPLVRAALDLAAARKRVLIGVVDLHDGAQDHRGEGLTVQQVYDALAGTAVVVVATVVPGGIDRPLFDHRVRVPIPSAPDLGAVAASVEALAPSGSLHERVLRVLAVAPAPLHVFAVCDGAELAGEAVFEPAVERALWDLRPLLAWRRASVEIDGRSERIRLWSAFHPVVAAALDRRSPA